MKKNTKLSIISGIAVFLVLFGVSQYKITKVKTPPTYMTAYKSKDGRIMTMGGMASDKEKIDYFKRDLEQDDESNRFWEHMDKYDRYTQKGEYSNAIEELKKASVIYPGDHMPHVFLAKLYEKTEQYEFAIKEYGWVIQYQEKAMAKSAQKGYKLDVERRQKLVNELKAGRKQAEELQSRVEILSSTQ
ncbi:MAG: hypothetical protein KJ661_03335 [Candidatus Omnitrophica bacterium]|nr:hypothetical protein [Candidatus Omnitrophota bacterium]